MSEGTNEGGAAGATLTLPEGATVDIDTETDRTTRFFVQDGELKFDTSSTPGPQITRISVDGKRLYSDNPLQDVLIEALYDSGELQ